MFAWLVGGTADGLEIRKDHAKKVFRAANPL